MNTRDGRPSRSSHARARAAALLALAVGLQTGCGREFFREWANQDVSEAVFEKSRDPRWRLDLFSVEPPALSRFASPYDPDRPPAPPDDYAAEQTSPVPQWPNNRLLIPAEGTGYLDMLEAWQRQNPRRRPRPAPAATAAPTTPAVVVPAPPPVPPAAGSPSPFTTPPAPGSPGAGAPGADVVPAPPTPEPPPPAVAPTPPAANPPTPGAGVNSGTAGAPMSPIPVPGARPTIPLERVGGTTTTPPGRPTAAAATGPPTDRPRDAGVTLTAFQTTGPDAPGAPAPAATAAPAAAPPPPPRNPGATLVAFQQTGLPLPVPPRAPTDDRPGIPPGSPPARDVRPPAIGMDPAPFVEPDLSAPVVPRRDQTPEQYRAAEAAASGLAGILVPKAVEFDEIEAAGLPRDSTPYVINMNQAFTLALINSRVYQFQLEQVYLAALGVTLQRFAFTPQVYAGLTPLTGVAGTGGIGGAFPGVIPGNVFNYQTRETGQQISTLNLGTAAGFGKLFGTGGRLLAGFANQVVFNFIGKNSFQPAVKSFLPLNLVQPFLRGGGRAVTLEPLTLAERNLLYSIRSFAKFRQEFTVATLVGGTITNFGSAVASLGFTGGGNNDPTIGYINLLQDLQSVENDRRNIAAYEQLVTVYQELIKGESSGLSQLQLDQVDQGLQGAKSQLIGDRTLYRNDLDSFKMQMGLPPDTPIIPDRSLTRKFKEVFDAVDEWQRNERRDLKDLPSFAERLPQLEDIVVDGRSLLGVYSEDYNNEDALEDTLLAVERVALEHRLDLMNARAQLYDSWRNIKVTANALQGVFNMNLTNQFVTPPNTTNPFAFLEQAKQFSLVINAELPLVRVSERNNFRNALIGYERQRRSLQNLEDATKNFLRQEIRNLHQLYLNYEIAKRNFILNIRLKDQAFEQIVAPPQGGAGAGNANAPLQTTNLVNFQRQLIGVENQLVQVWYNYESARLQLYRDLGTLPFDEWEAFHELFPAEPIGEGTTAPAARGPRPAGAAAPRAEAPVGGGR